MLRITRLCESATDVTLKLEGRVVSAWAGELDAECRRLLALGRRVRLDLRNVTAADSQGLSILNALSREAVHMSDCPALIREMLDDAQDR